LSELDSTQLEQC